MQRVAGLLMEDEQMMMEKTRSIYRQYFVPIVWACNLVERAKREGKVKDEFTYQNLIKVRQENFLKSYLMYR